MNTRAKLPKLLIATHNEGKSREFEKALKPYAASIVSAAALKLPEPEETEKTFAGNAKLKAVAAAKASGLLTVADDSGFGLVALDGRPGVLSARFAKKTGKEDYDDAARRLMEALDKGETRAAFFTCVLALARPTGAAYCVEGRCTGTMIYPGRGTLGFGYDPYFVPDSHTLTFGELKPDEKHALSHRGKALARLIAFFASDDGRAFTGQ